MASTPSDQACEGSPERRPSVVTEAIGPFGGVRAARQPRISLTVSSCFSCSRRGPHHHPHHRRQQHDRAAAGPATHNLNARWVSPCRPGHQPRAPGRRRRRPPTRRRSAMNLKSLLRPIRTQAALAGQRAEAAREPTRPSVHSTRRCFACTTCVTDWPAWARSWAHRRCTHRGRPTALKATGQLPSDPRDGAAPCFTMAVAGLPSDEVRVWNDIKAATTEVLHRDRCTITHHRTVDCDHRPATPSSTSNPSHWRCEPPRTAPARTTSQPGCPVRLTGRSAEGERPDDQAEAKASSGTSSRTNPLSSRTRTVTRSIRRW